MDDLILDIELFANCLRLSGEGLEKTDSNCLYIKTHDNTFSLKLRPLVMGDIKLMMNVSGISAMLSNL